MPKLTSTIIEGMPPAEKPFPKIMKSGKGKIIVLFSRWSVGMCLYNKEDPGNVGCLSETWDMEYFTDYSGPLTITFNIED